MFNIYIILPYDRNCNSADKQGEMCNETNRILLIMLLEKKRKHFTCKNTFQKSIFYNKDNVHAMI